MDSTAEGGSSPGFLYGRGCEGSLTPRGGPARTSCQGTCRIAVLGHRRIQWRVALPPLSCVSDLPSHGRAESEASGLSGVPEACASGACVCLHKQMQRSFRPRAAQPAEEAPRASARYSGELEPLKAPIFSNASMPTIACSDSRDVAGHRDQTPPNCCCFSCTNTARPPASPRNRKPDSDLPDGIT